MMAAASPWRQSAAALTPAVLLVLLTVLAAQFPIPFLALHLPLLPALISVYYWSLFRPASLPLLFLAAFSLPHDVLYGLPLGASLMLFLATRFISSWMRGRMIFEQFVLVWVAFAPVMLLLLLLLCLCVHWAQHVGFTQLLSAYDTVFFISWCAYPLLHLLFNWCYHQLPSRP